VQRDDGYAAIRDYAVIGDGRTCALVALDGSIDWLCLPNVDSPAVFSRLLDARKGGYFELRPDEPFEAERRYLDSSNVLETTFRTSSGSARVTDAMCLTDMPRIAPLRELVRKVEGVSGEVRMRWRFEPRFGFAEYDTRLQRRGRRAFALHKHDALALSVWGAGEGQERGGGFEGSFTVTPDTSVLLDLSATNNEPMFLPSRDYAERALARTERFWPEWARGAEYDGPWRGEVIRGALVLKLLVYAPSGAIVAAPTSSLPEWVGAGRNWDYRYSWIRDASWTLDALLRLGYHDEAHAYFWWLMHASRLTHPRLQILYGVDGSAHTPEQELRNLDGYRRSRPVRVGNGAAAQVQLDVYGALLETAWLYVKEGHELDKATGKEIAAIADYVCDCWEQKDSGIWEVRSEATHFTQSKALCWIALDRATKLAERGVLPDRREKWQRAARRIHEFVEQNGWDDERGSFVRAPDQRELDASLLTLSLLGFDDPKSRRIRGTVDAIRRELSVGPLVYRYRGEDGLEGEEGAFLTCSFWLVDALARDGRLDEAIELMEQLVPLSNDVGLFSEEMNPETKEFLGNFPQGLTHLSLVNAAITIEDVKKTGAPK
jgi:GH15 family glucan-1,4-alpha-glucosidase